MNLLLLDSGHAKNTAGKKAPDNSFFEWDFNNIMQYKIKKRAEDHGIHVYLSNPNPGSISDIPLSTRAANMNNYWSSKGKPKAMMISIHANAYSDKNNDKDGFNNARGTETFVASNASTASKNFAKSLNNEIVATMKKLDSGAKDRGVKTENWTVIYKTHTPCVLAEYAFYSNKNDLYILKNKQDELVEATIKAICSYFNVQYKSITTNSSSSKKYENCILYGNDIDKVAAEILSWGKNDCIVKNAKNHIAGEGFNLFAVGGLAKTELDKMKTGERYTAFVGKDRFETVNLVLKHLNK